MALDIIFTRLSKSRFRSRFHLGARERAYVSVKGMEVIEDHANQFVLQRLSAAYPRNDGKQTPMRGHPVFIAQHATASCCRACLEKWHKVRKGSEITSEQTLFIVSLIVAWIKAEMEQERS